MIIVYCLNEEFLYPFLASVTSIIKNTKSDNIQFVILHSRDSLNNIKQDIDKYINYPTHFEAIQENIFSNFSGTRFGKESFYKTLIPHVFPNSEDRVIYLDCDTIVLSDISELWKTNIDNYHLAAVQDMWRPFTSSPEGVSRWKELNHTRHTPFFNSGVMVLNLNKLRECKISSRALDYVKSFKNEMNVIGDQEVLNALLAGKWKPLSFEWNVVSPIYRSQGKSVSDFLDRNNIDPLMLAANPKIIHYTGYLERPWKPESYFAHRQPHPKRSIFNHYLWSSGWFKRYQWYLYHLSFYIGRVEKTLEDYTRPIRHRCRKFIRNNCGIDLSFLGGSY